MKLYAVYSLNDNGSRAWIDSYWLNYKNAVARFKQLWPYCRKPDKSEIDFYVKSIETKDWIGDKYEM